MAAWVCVGCTTTYSVGAPRCPHCGGTEHVEQGAEMPKITVHGGPSIAGASVVGGSWSNEGDPDVWPEPASEESASEEAETSPEPDYEAWTVEELKEQLAARSLAKSGSKGDLVQRLREDDANAAEPGAE